MNGNINGKIKQEIASSFLILDIMFMDNELLIHSNRSRNRRDESSYIYFLHFR